MGDLKKKKFVDFLYLQVYNKNHYYKEKKENEKVYILGSIKSKNKQAIIWEPVDNWYELMSFLEDWDWKS